MPFSRTRCWLCNYLICKLLNCFWQFNNTHRVSRHNRWPDPPTYYIMSQLSIIIYPISFPIRGIWQILSSKIAIICATMKTSLKSTFLSLMKFEKNKFLYLFWPCRVQNLFSKTIEINAIKEKKLWIAYICNYVHWWRHAFCLVGVNSDKKKSIHEFDIIPYKKVFIPNQYIA